MNPPGSPRVRRLRVPSMIVLVGLLVGLLPLGPSASARTPAADFGLSFDGTDDYVSMGNAGGAAVQPLGASQFTLEIWFRRNASFTNSTSTGTGGFTNAIPLLTKGRGEADAQSNLDTNYFLGLQNAAGADQYKLIADFEDVATSGNHPALGGTVVTANAWHHAAVTYDGSNMRIYLDGNLDSTTATTGTPRFDSIQHAAIGSALTSTGTAAGFFGGQADEARIWNFARTQTQIQSTINDEVTAASGLIGRWGMNEGTGTTIADSSGSGVTGTLGAGVAAARPTWVAGAHFGNSGVVLNNPGPTAGTAVGNQQYVSMGPDQPSTGNAALGANSFTLEIWFKRTGNGVTTTTGTSGLDGGAPTRPLAIPLLTKGRGESDGSNLDMNYFLGLTNPSDATNPNRLAVDFEDANSNLAPNPSGGLNHPFIGVTVVTQNVWHHAAATYDTASGVWRLYLDGALDATSVPQLANATGSPIAVPRADSIQHAAIGSALTSTGVPAGFFQGVVDEARVWNVVRSGANIAAGVNQSIASGPGLLGSWRLNEGTGTAAANTGSAAGSGGRLFACNQSTGSCTSNTHGPSSSVAWGLGAPFAVNHAPTVAPVINQASPHTNDILTVTANDADSDGDPRTLDYQWRKNGVDIAGATGPTLNLGPPNDLSKGDAISVRVRAHDGFTYSAPVISGAVTILNTAPVVDSVTIDQSGPGPTDTLSATILDHDDDGDSLTYAYLWFENGSPLGGQTNATLDLGAVGAGNGDQYALRVTANDGAADSNPVTSAAVTVTVGNSAPTATVSLNDTTPDTDDTLTATATRDDVDGDTVTLTYVWTVNGTVRQTTSNSTSLTDTFDLSPANHGNKGQTVVVTVTPNDGTVDGAPVADSATIQNSAPTASVSLNDTTPDTDDTLTATATRDDIDGDTVTLTYVWTVDGTVRKTTSNSSSLTDTFDLNAANNGNKGQTVTVTVTPNDGSVNGLTDDDSAVIQNSAPTATVSLDDTTPATNATLTATATKNDLDGDIVTLTYVWTVNGTVRRTTVMTGLTDTFDLNAANNGNKGQTVTVTVTPNDGSVNGLTDDDSAVIQNSPPTTTVALNDHSPNTNDTLTATATKADLDGDTITLTYVWTVNGTVRKTTVTSSSLTDTFDLSQPNNGNNGQTVTVTVTPSDGTVAGTPVDDSATIGNVAPTASVSLNDTTPDTDDTLTATATRDDVDGDTVTLTYVWTVDGTVRKTTSNSSSLTDTFDLNAANNGNKGQTVTVTVTPNDGSVNGLTDDDSAVIQNSAPTATVALNNHSPDTNATLTATATRSDLDGDIVTLTYVWDVNGTVRRTTVTTALTDTFDLSQPNNGNNGQTVTVTVTPSDGTVAGTPVDDSASIGNVAPTATVSLDNHSPDTNATLTATATRSDLDGDTVTLTYVWDVNGTVRRTTVTTALTDTFDLSLAGNGDVGQVVTVTVTPSDGTIAGTPVDDSATVTGGGGNLAPVATNSNYGVTKAQARTITLRATDPENAALTYTIVTPPNSGTIQAGTGPDRIYTPVNTFTGTVTFTFRANDGSLNSNIATVTITIAPMKKVTINDASFNPVNVAPAMCAAVRFVNKGTATHSVADTGGLLLFSSGPIAPNAEFRYRYSAAGNYTFQVAGQGTVGRSKVPLKITPASGGTSTQFTVQWACEDPAPGFVFDIQIKRGTGAFVNWQNGVTSMGTIFTPDAGPRVYKFRARLRNTAGGAISGWSAAKAITVS